MQDVLKEFSQGAPYQTEINAVLLALRGHLDRAKGMELVREGSCAAASARGERPPSEMEIDFVHLHIRVWILLTNVAA